MLFKIYLKVENNRTIPFWGVGGLCVTWVTMETTYINISPLYELIYLVGHLMLLCAEFYHSKLAGQWVVHIQNLCHGGNGSIFRHKFSIKSMFLAHRKFQIATALDIVSLMSCSCNRYIIDQLSTPHMLLCHENLTQILWKKWRPTLTNNLNLHNFLLISDSGSLSYWTQHTKIYKWGKFHALIIFWTLLQLSSWTNTGKMVFSEDIIVYFIVWYMKVSLTFWHLINVIYKHWFIHFYTTFLTSVLMV